MKIHKKCKIKFCCLSLFKEIKIENIQSNKLYIFFNFNFLETIKKF